MTISYLDEHPQHVETIARRHHTEWSELKPELSLAMRVSSLRASLATRALPLTMIAVEGTQVLGSASLIESDMDTHPEWTPWLASVYVDEAQRRRGIGTALVERIITEAERLSFARLYLYTSDQAALYARLGWQLLTNEPYRGNQVSVMSRPLRHKGR